jgi:hypothetical protein
MSKRIYLDAFYDQYEDFLQQLTSVFPDDPDWSRYRTGVAVIRRANPMALATTTWDYVSPFEDIIRARNDSFFLGRDFSDMTGGQEPLNQTIGKLKGMWQQMTPHNQSIVWDYITNITYLAKRCTESPPG